MSNNTPFDPQQPPAPPQSAYPAPAPPPTGLPNTSTPPPVGYPSAPSNAYPVTPDFVANKTSTKREGAAKSFPFLAGVGILAAIVAFWFDGMRVTVFALLLPPLTLGFTIFYRAQAQKAGEALGRWNLTLALAIIATVLGLGGQLLKFIILGSL